MALQLIGDELVHDGLVIAVLAQTGVPASIMAQALSGVDRASHDDLVTELLEDCSCKHREECPLHRTEVGTARSELEEVDRETLLALFEEHSTNGLLRFSDVADLLNKYMDGEL